jgi:putative glycosyltransferase (TIGR04372 family)
MSFISRQFIDIRNGGVSVLLNKIVILSKLCAPFIRYLPALPVVIFIRLAAPLVVFRIQDMMGERIGHFAGNMEIYLCELDSGIGRPRNKLIIDIFSYISGPPCNKQLAKMWVDKIRIWPSWLMRPIYLLNCYIPGGSIHEIETSQEECDIYGLMTRYPAHLKFTSQEKENGKKFLQDIGVGNSPFVCLIVRDSAYLEKHLPRKSWYYHDYRDSDIQDYLLAAEELTKRGYFVIRMGSIVHSAMETDNPSIINYATNGMRSDFLDIYLGAKCKFCISTSTGFDAIPVIFRKPVAFVNMNPLGRLPTFVKGFVAISKRLYSNDSCKELTLSELFSIDGLSLCGRLDCYILNNIKLIQNTPEEIKDLVIEMDERLNGTWIPHKDDIMLQKKFWGTFPFDTLLKDGKPLHGKIRGYFSAKYLRDNREWLK